MAVQLKASPRKLYELEMFRWDSVPFYLHGKTVASIRELQAEIPGDRYFGRTLPSGALPNTGLTRYTRHPKNTRFKNEIRFIDKDVAYDCSKCNEIVIGPPKLSIGREKLRFNCRNCGGYLGSSN